MFLALQLNRHVLRGLIYGVDVVSVLLFHRYGLRATLFGIATAFAKLARRYSFIVTNELTRFSWFYLCTRRGPRVSLNRNGFRATTESRWSSRNENRIATVYLLLLHRRGIRGTFNGPDIGSA